MILYCNRIYMEDGIKDGYLTVEDGKITAFTPASEQLTADKDYTGLILIPGIIDTHNHGCFGYDLMKTPIPKEDIEGYLYGLATQGVTAAFPTVSGSALGIKSLAEYEEYPLKGARIMGIHSEGPWGARVGEKGINTGYPQVDLDYAKEMVEAGQGKLRLVDVAPEVENGLDAVRYFKEQGVTVGIYHTNSNFEQANQAIDAGVTVATHLGNVMTGLHHRDIGTLGACLFRPEVDCEMICDDLHVSLEMIRLYLKVKDSSRFMMISDNVRYAGLPTGHYKGMASNANSDRKTIHITEDGFVLSETGRLSGSSKPVIYGIKNLVTKLDIPLEEVIKMSSLNPARKYGFDDHKGSLALGKDADFVVINDNFDVRET
ncbi:MAG: amidohydrolase family protein, partial [Erysipelotrichaceae bacterium]|nr:amidohydrolase family protein [Erysipelotrichaceae bacterium]